MKTVVIFGGSGFVGKNIVRRLVKEGSRIIIPYQLSTNEAKLRLFGNVGQIIPVKYNILKDRLISNIISEADAVINLKTIWRESQSFKYKRNILNFNIQLVDLINSISKDKFFLFFSGLGVSKKSSSLRSQYIAESEKYILEHMKNSLIIRPGIIVGAEDQFIKKLLFIFKFSLFIPLFGKGNYKLQPVFIDDIAKAICKIIYNSPKGKIIYELAGPEIFTYKELYKYICLCLEIKRTYISIPFNLSKILAKFLEKTPFTIITYEQLLLLNEDNIIQNTHKSFSHLNIQPKDVRDIIKKIIKNHT